MDDRSTKAWRFVACLLAWSGCLGHPDPPPPPLAGTEGSGAETTTGAASEGDAATELADSTTAPIAECGNGDVDDVEECDGPELNGATCESLGFSGDGLTCVACQLDGSQCGPPPGMVEVPGGPFEMGSNIHPNEMPIRQVEVDRFWMDATEVTVQAYAACVDAGPCSEPSSGTGCNWEAAGRENHPVNCVTWSQATAYCEWVDGGTKRLPTEAEWEKAARGTDARAYPWGDSPAPPSCSHAVMLYGCGMGSTWPVGIKTMGDSPYGAHDMAGNVWEWVADWYAGSYDESETDNPTGPETGWMRILRGASWKDDPAKISFRAAHRNDYDPTDISDAVGFRCARTPPAPL